MLNYLIEYSSHYNYHANETYFKYRIQIEVLDVIKKITFVMFDRDVENILNKLVKDLAKKQTKVQITSYVIN